MRKIIYICLLAVLVSTNITAQELTWHTDVEKAAQLSMKEKKPLLMFFTGSDWCGWCVKLQKDVLKTSKFKEWAKEHVVLVELDFPRRTVLDEKTKMQNYQIQQMFQVRGYPTVVFAQPEKTPEGKISLNHLGRTGYVRGGVKGWLDVANEIINVADKTKKSNVVSVEKEKQTRVADLQRNNLEKDKVAAKKDSNTTKQGDNDELSENKVNTSIGFTTYVVKKDDSLSKIAQKFYGDYKLYTQIFEANKDVIANPEIIFVNQVIKLPKLK